MNRFVHPLIGWLEDNDDVPYNLASSSIPDYELSTDSSIEGGRELGHDHEIEDELIEKIYSFYEEDVYPVTTFGAQSANFLTLLTILEKGSNVIIEDPTYLPIQKIAESMGNEVRILKRKYEKDFKIDIEEIKDKFDDNTKAVVLTHPHNPSGLYSDVDEMKELHEFLLDNDAYLIVDEVFRDILDDAESTNSLGKNVIATNSLSKVYGMGGIRFGWTVTKDEELADNMYSTKLLSITSTSSISEMIALCELEKRDKILQRSKDISDRGKSIVKDWIKDNDYIHWKEPLGGIISFPKLDISCSTMKLAEKARDEGVLVSPGKYFTRTHRFKDHIRLTFGEDPDIIKTGLEKLSKVIDECR